jgi:hypothetical protein
VLKLAAPDDAEQMMTGEEMDLLPATWMRGGTSKCWLFKASELRVGELAMGNPELEELLVRVFGSGDPRQINGVGGGTSTTSKAAFVRRSTRPDADVDYLFAQVGTDARSVDWTSNCGNCASAVALHALEEAIAPTGEEESVVRLFNINTGARLDAVIPTKGAVIPVVGTATIPGVVGGGVPVEVLFRDAAGSTTGATLPTGMAIDTVEAPQGSIDVTYVDAGAPAMLLRASDFAIRGTELPAKISRLVAPLIALRGAGARRIGLVGPDGVLPNAVPKVGLVAPPAEYRTVEGTTIAGENYDVAARMISMGDWHPMIGITSVIALTVAAFTEGTLVHGIVGPRRDQGAVRIGTPGGVVTGALRREAGGNFAVGTLRTARRLANAALFVGGPSLRADEENWDEENRGS